MEEFSDRDALEVGFSPNPSNNDVSAVDDSDSLYDHIWHYEMTVQNRSDRKLKVVWFESCIEDDYGQWQSCSESEVVLRHEAFSSWFSGAGSFDEHGWIFRGKRVTCDSTWAGSNSKHFLTENGVL